MDAIPKDLRLLFAGGASGAMTYTLIAPLERTKILLQVQGMRASTKYTGIGQTLVTVVREEGFLALYKASDLSIIFAPCLTLLGQPRKCRACGADIFAQIHVQRSIQVRRCRSVLHLLFLLTLRLLLVTWCESRDRPRTR
jgi:hypothetical protein